MNISMNIKLLPKIAIYAAVAEEKSFTVAAEKLKLSTPVISQHISDLEKSLGVKLISRSTKGLSLTKVGEEVYLHARSIVEQLDKIFLSVDKNYNDNEFNILIPQAASDIGMKYTSILCLRYPQLLVNIQTYNKTIDNDKFDIIFHVGNLELKNKICRNFGQTNLVVCATNDFWLRYPDVKQPRDLIGLPFLGGENSNSEFIDFVDSKNNYHTIKLTNKYTFDSIHSLLPFLIKNNGFAILSEKRLQQIDDKRVVTKLDNYRLKPLMLYACFDFLSPKKHYIEEFISIASCD